MAPLSTCKGHLIKFTMMMMMMIINHVIVLGLHLEMLLNVHKKVNFN